MNRRIERTLACVVSMLLILFSPGLGAYSAFAQTVAQNAVVVPGVSASLAGVGAVQASKAGVFALVEGLQIPLPSILPAPSGLGVQVLFPQIQNSGSSVLKSLKLTGSYKDSKMPSETPDRDSGPDSTDGLDGLGNTPRRGSDGPDSSSDGSDNDRSGNSGLFRSILRGSKSFLQLKAFFTDSGSMPDESGADRDDSPDGSGGLDELGNQRRRGGEGGPDSGWDGSDNDRGGGNGPFSTEFKSAKSSLKQSSKQQPDDSVGPDEVPSEFPDRDSGGSPDGVGPEFPSRSPYDDGPDGSGGVLFRSGVESLRLSRVGGGVGELRAARGSRTLPLKFFGLAVPVLAAVSAASIFPTTLLGGLASYFGILLPSLILHEMAHAWVADRLGDPTPRSEGRMSWSLKGMLTHIDPIMTVLVPVGMMLVSWLMTGVPLFIGAARPVSARPDNFRDPVAGMAKTALAGPLANILIAAAAGLVFQAASLFAMPVGLMNFLVTTAFVNVFLGLFNLMPLYFFGSAALDGAHAARGLISKLFGARAAAALFGDPVRGLSPAAKAVHSMLFMAVLLNFSAWFFPVVSHAADFFLGRPIVQSLGAVQPDASSAAALRAGLGPKPQAADDDPELGMPTEDMPASVDLIVRFDGAAQPLNQDLHLSFVRASWQQVQGYVNAYLAVQNTMRMELEAAGLGSFFLDRYGVTPVATYSRINSATLRVSADRADSLRADLEGRGFKVYENRKIRIPEPIAEPTAPEAGLPSREPVTILETLELSDMARLHQEVFQKWGAPAVEMGFFGRAALSILNKFGLFSAPQPKIAVIDTGADTAHPMLRGVQNVDAAGGRSDSWHPEILRENTDDNGHGTWVTSMVRAYAPWAKEVRHYKAFVAGEATTDDILKVLSLAANDGNIIFSDAWGSSIGDPESPESLMVRKLAEEGRVMVFSAGNGGPRPDTIGSPAIVSYKDAKTGAPRVIAVAATDRDRKTAYFSSRGKGSPRTSSDPRYNGWPQRPDIGEEGYNTEGAWPTDKVPGRVDSVMGPLKSLSGSSMSEPKVAGTILMLAQLFGVTSVGEKLDAVVNAVFKTLVHPQGQGVDEIGQGFNAVYAAYEELCKTMQPVLPGFLLKPALWVMRKSAMNRYRNVAQAGI
ncbi:MAG: S8 family serine peptidase [Elusimicrobiota bacterium]